MTNYTLWLIPENELREELEEIIARYAKKYHSPVFIPHITLYSGVLSTNEVVTEKLRNVAKNIHPFKLELGNVAFSTTYFQSVLVRVKTTAKLLNTHLAIKKAFDIQEQHVYMPHMSLVYGDFDMETREKIASEIKIKNRQFMGKKIAVVNGDSDDPADWVLVDQIPFA